MEAAEPVYDAALAAVAVAFTQPEYVYLFRVVTAAGVPPKAKIPTVELPAAEPPCEAALADVAVPLVSLEYVYLPLVLVVVPQPKRL